MPTSNPKFASTKTKNDFMNQTDSLKILPSHDPLKTKKHLQDNSHVGNLPQHITNGFDSTNDRALSVKGFIKIDEVKNDGCISPLSYLLLFINFLMANITLEMLGGGFERCFGATQRSPTEERACKEVGVVFLDFFLFCVDFLLTSNFFKTFGILLLGGNI